MNIPELLSDLQELMEESLDDGKVYEELLQVQQRIIEHRSYEAQKAILDAAKTLRTMCAGGYCGGKPDSKWTCPMYNKITHECVLDGGQPQEWEGF